MLHVENSPSACEISTGAARGELSGVVRAGAGSFAVEGLDSRVEGLDSRLAHWHRREGVEGGCIPPWDAGYDCPWSNQWRMLQAVTGRASDVKV